MTTIEKSVERLAYTIANKNKPNDTDVKALQFIGNWINECRAEFFREQQLFAKLYAMEFRRAFVGTRDLKYAKQQMDAILSTPLSDYFDRFHFDFNVLKFKMYMESKKIPWVEEPYETEEDRQLVIESIQNDPDFKKHLLGYWSREKIEESLSNEIHDAFNRNKQKI